MKEIIAIIRIDKVNQTKDALLNEGFPAVTCRKVMGRGKKKIAYELFQNVFDTADDLSPVVAEQLSEEHRLMPKRMIIILAEDKDTEKIVETIIAVNKNGNPGNGKIFVSPLNDVVRIRTGESGEIAI